MYIDEKRLNDLAVQVNAAFKAQELTLETMRKDIKALQLKITEKKGK